MTFAPDSLSARALSKKRAFSATVPDRIADHRLVRPIASGSYGDVWLARNELTGTYRAVKIVWAGAFSRSKPYEREFDAIKRFEPVSRQHPGFVHVLQTGALQPHGFYYIMELADDIRAGRAIDAASYKPCTLAAVRDQSITVEQAIKIAISLARSLDVLHEAGLLHRDVKPSNVIFVGGQPKLADIGMVAAVSDDNSFVGTNGFMAPEGPTTPLADVYSLGKLLYEIATGQDRLDFPNLPATIPRDEALLIELNQVLIKACDPNPSKRHQSARALADELEFLLQGKSVRRLRQLEKALRWTKASLLTTILVFGALFLIYQSFEARWTAEAREEEGRIATALAHGNDRVRNGDYLGALSYFAQGAALNKRPSADHRLRLGSTLAYAPKILSRNPGAAEETCVSADGSRYAFASSNSVFVAASRTGEVLSEYPGNVTLLGLNRTGARVALIRNDQVTFKSLVSPESLTSVMPTYISSVAFSDSDLAVLALTNGTIQFIPGPWRIVFTNGPIFKATLSPSGRFVCVLDMQGGATLFDAKTLLPLPVRIKHKLLIYHALFTRNESALITTSYDRTAICWDLSTGQQIGFPMEHDDGVIYAAESPNGRIIATGSLDQTVRLWDASNFSRLRENQTFYHPHRITWLSLIDEDLLLVRCSDGTTWRWNLCPPQSLVQEVPPDIKVPARNSFTSAGVELHSASNVVTGKIENVEFHATLSSAVSAVAVSPRHDLVAIATSNVGFGAGAVRVFRSSGEPFGLEMAHRDGVVYVAFSHSGEKLVSCSEDFTSRIWSTRGKRLTPLLSHTAQVRWAAFNNSDEWLVTGSWDQTVRIWSVKTGVPITPPLKVDNIVEWVSFQGDHRLLIANSKRNYIMDLPYYNDSPERLLREIPAPPELLMEFEKL